MLQSQLDGKHRIIFASGLRNTIGFDWHPQTDELWGMDHGIDCWGDDLTPEELNRIEKGKRYGWPYLFGDNQESPRLSPSGKLTIAQWKQSSTPMVVGYTAHAAPMQMAFYYANQFPPAYRGDAFVAMHGSWNRQPPSGYEIVRVHFEDGKAVSIMPFLTGFLSSKGHMAAHSAWPWTSRSACCLATTKTACFTKSAIKMSQPRQKNSRGQRLPMPCSA